MNEVGGSLGFADPLAQIGYGYIPNRKSVALGGDPRDMAIRKALYSTTPAGSYYCLARRPRSLPQILRPHRVVT